MSGIGTGYDLSVSTFSPDGKVFQTEYAQKAVDNSGTVIGIRCKDGVVLGVAKQVISKMIVEGSSRRIHTVARHAGMAAAGLSADGRMIANRAEDEAAEYRRFYGEVIPGKVLSDRVANYLHLFNLYWSVRMVAAVLEYEEDSLSMERMPFSRRYYGAAIGKHRQAAKTEIERLKMGEMSTQQGVMEVARILYTVHDEGKELELEMTWLCEATQYMHQRVPEELAQEAIRSAKVQLSERDMEDD